MNLCLLIVVSALIAAPVFGQPPQPTPEKMLSAELEAILTLVAGRGTAVKFDRECAYARLHEGQRHMWRSERVRSRTGRLESVRLAREAFKRSIEADPTVSEGYVALAELALAGSSQDFGEAIKIAKLGVRVNARSYGARRLLARLYTYQSRVIAGPFDAAAGAKALDEWNVVTQLDPANAEAWALLSELYAKTGREPESVEALRRWISSAAPADTRFYQMITGGQQLSPETASVKLGGALLKAGQYREAIDLLSGLLAENPDNPAAADLLKNALENADSSAAGIAAESLRRAIATYPSNVRLISLLAETYVKAGKTDEGVSILRRTADRLRAENRSEAFSAYTALGDLYRASDEHGKAVEAYELAIGDSDDARLIEEIYEKVVQTLKGAERFDDARTAIVRASERLGKENDFSDRQMVSLLRETGDRLGALTILRSLRKKAPLEQGLLRLEATLMTELGKVDEAAALFRREMAAMEVSTQPAGTSRSTGTMLPASDPFSNHLFLATIYGMANRGRDAADEANKAYAVARGGERKQIARLTLASAQQMSGDFASAETTLRGLLKETPGNPIALNNLGYFLAERNTSLPEALRLVQEAVKIDPTNPSYLDSLGWVYFKLGRLDEAAKALEDARRYDSSNATIHEHLGDVYFKQGKTDLARASWKRAQGLFTQQDDLRRVKKKLEN